MMSPPICCSTSTFGSGLRHEERPLRHHVVLEVPISLGGLEERFGQRQPRVVHDDVDPAEGEHGRLEGGGDRVTV